MLPISVRRFFGNIAGSFVADINARHRVRVNVSAPLWRCMRFVRRIHGRQAIIEKFYGMGGKSLILGVNGKYVYKFSCMHNANEIAIKENAIYKYFKDISPIYIPNMVLIKNGHELVRRYEYVHGTALSTLSPDLMVKNANKLGKQIAKFLYEIALCDPDCLKQYKTHAIDFPRMFYGWNHNDWDNLENFIIDKKTMKITAVIDWENAQYRDFYYRLYRTEQPEKCALFDVVEREYKKLYLKNAAKQYDLNP